MPRPAQLKLDALYRQLQDEPSHGPGTFKYPRPRARKPGDIPTGAMVEDFLSGAPPTAGAAPIVRLWPFALEETAAGDRNVTSPFFRGPAVLESVFLQWDDDNTSPRPTITISYGPTLPPTGQNAGLALAAFGTMIFQDGVISTEAGTPYQSPLQHLPKWSGAGASQRLQYFIRFPIALDRFQLLLRFGTQGAGSHVVMGFMRVLEAIPTELLASYL